SFNIKCHWRQIGFCFAFPRDDSAQLQASNPAHFREDSWRKVVRPLAIPLGSTALSNSALAVSSRVAFVRGWFAIVVFETVTALLYLSIGAEGMEAAAAWVLATAWAAGKALLRLADGVLAAVVGASVLELLAVPALTLASVVVVAEALAVLTTVVVTLGALAGTAVLVLAVIASMSTAMSVGLVN
ncbi:Protein of unknown function, partial [Gryllus bimaculatus]